MRKRQRKVSAGCQPEKSFFIDLFGLKLEPSGTESSRRRESCALAGYEDGSAVVYPANAFDSCLRGDSVPLDSSPTKSQIMIGTKLF